MPNTSRSANVTVHTPIRCTSISFVFDLPPGKFSATVEEMHVALRGRTVSQIARVLVEVDRETVIGWGGKVSEGFDSAAVNISAEVAKGEATLS